MSGPCLVCGSPTQSHPVPMGYLCHGCVTDREESELLEALTVPPLPEAAVGDTVDCPECDHGLAINAATFITAVTGALPFETVPGALFLGCPGCGERAAYPTTDDAVRDVAADLGHRMRDSGNLGTNRNHFDEDYG